LSVDEEEYVPSLTISDEGVHQIFVKLNYSDLGFALDHINIFGIGCTEISISVDIYLGDGTSTKPYPVACAAQLDNVRQELNKYYLQLCNIELDPNTNFLSIGNNTNKFTGTYDGNNFKIIGFFENTTNGDSYAGLFGCVDNGGILKNIWLYGNVDISSSVSVVRIGLLCGFNWGVTINCHCFGSIKCKVTSTLGGLIGQVVSASNCSAEVDIEGLSGTGYIGGLCGELLGSSLSGCSAKSYIHGYGTYIGGLCGIKTDTNFICTDSYSQSVINMSSATAIGGFIGRDLCTKTSGNKYYSNCYVATIIVGGGIVKKGFCGARVSGCTSTQSDCLWDSEISGIEDDTFLPVENGLSSIQLRDKDLLIGTYNYSVIFWMFVANHYPRFVWENESYPKV